MASFRSRRTRIESDSLGTVEVPADALYGAQTQRALQNFVVEGQRSIGEYPCLIEGLMLIKEAAARVNGRIGSLECHREEAIIQAARTVIQDKLFDQFPIHFLHGGGGTSANMNANEVLANMAEESSLDAALHRLIQSLDERAEELVREPRIARTCLQDAVDITFGDLLGGYSSFVKRARARVETAVEELYGVNIGGTIVGRKQDAPEAYRREIVPTLGQVTGDSRYHIVSDLFDAAQNPDAMAAVSAQLAILARALIKIAKDFRLMASGPETGLCEIILPAVQPGSSIMPGKVNPVIPEFLIQLCFQVLGADASCQAALDHGELDLNVWESTMVFNILDSMSLLTTGLTVFATRCIEGFRVNRARNAANVNAITPLLIRLMREYGYSRVSETCKRAGGEREAPDIMSAKMSTR
jgi:aspartate ammonia-lyase